MIPFDIANRPVRTWGYSSFLSLIRMLWQQNRMAKKLGVQTRYDIVLPVRWF